MKKLLFLTFLLLPIVAQAQLNITAKASKSEKVLTLTAGVSWVYHSDLGYQYVSSSTNQFDNPVSLFLGETSEECLATIADLRQILEARETVSVISLGKRTTIIATNPLGSYTLSIKNEGNAGNSWITKANLDKMEKFFQKEKGE